METLSSPQIVAIVVKVVAIVAYLILFFGVVQSKAERSIRLLFSLYMIGMLVWQLSSLMISLPGSARAALVWYNLEIAGGSVDVLFYPLALAFAQSKKSMIMSRLAYASCALMIAAGSFQLIWTDVVRGLGGYWVPVYNNPRIYIAGSLWYLFYICGIVVLLRALPKEKSPERRNRMFYMILGGVLVVFGLSTNLTPMRDFPIDITFNLISAITIGYAVIKYKLLDIRFVLVRSLFYSALTAFLIAAYVVLVFGLGRGLQRSLGYTGSTYDVFAVLILAFLFLPLRNALQALIDKVFFREKGDYQKAMQVFSKKIASLYEEEPILELVCQTVQDAAKPAFVALSLYDGGSGTYVVRHVHGAGGEAAEVRERADSALALWLRKEGKPLKREESLLDPETRDLADGTSAVLAAEPVSIIVPVLLNERLLGILTLGDKRSGVMYNADDLRFLSTIANQAATALDKSEIFLKIQRRLAEQTLLFVLSEKFRGSSDFDSTMNANVEVLKSFLVCDQCAFLCFDKAGKPKVFAQDRLSRIAAELCAEVWAALGLGAGGAAFDEAELVRRLRALTAERGDLSAAEADAIGSLSFRALSHEENLLGLLAISRTVGGPSGYERENELLRTVQAIISQGIVLNRTIADLLNLESYNEKILDSLNDMGDTLVILNQDGRINQVNKATCALLEYSEEELVGAPIQNFLADDGGVLSGEGLRELLQNRPVSNRELSYRAKSGLPIPMLFSGSSLSGENGGSREIIGIARDMTERRKAEEAMKNLLLVKEIHHRIKNNLQVISSLLVLQASYVQDEEVKDMFRESQFRVRSMALIHEKLYRSQTPSEIDFSEYAQDLARSLLSSYNLGESKVELSIDIADAVLGMDSAVPCGLIINELVSNALKHAFPDRASGRILVWMRPAERPAWAASGGSGASGASDRFFELRVHDDGVGLPENLDIATANTLGLKIVRTLTRQLKGVIDIGREGGTKVSIVFQEQR